jgi:Helix-turn-helix
MTMSADPVFLLGKTSPPFTSLRGRSLTTTEAVRDAFGRSRRGKWLAPRAASLSLLVDAVEAHHTWHRLLVLDQPSTARRELLSTLFRVVVAPGDGVRLLPAAEIAEVLAHEHPESLLIGGVADREDKALVLYRGSLERLVVPFSWFLSLADRTKPSFEDFEVIDNGQTVRLGKYEAAADAILYEFDPEARARMKGNLIEKDESFGGSLRRLRLLRGVSRDGFNGIGAKTIARIERGEVGKPQAKTLARIAKKLGVEVDAIETF